MAFKRNLPLVGGFVIAAGIVAALIILQPSDSDRLHAAALQYAHAQGSVTRFELRDAIALVGYASGAAQYVEFAKKDGRWAFHRDLEADFRAFARDPALADQVAQRLAKRLFDRFRQEIKFKEGIGVRTYLETDPLGIAARYLVGFTYPNGSSGQYVETFRYKDGRWTSEGLGRMRDQAPSNR
jgi:hypothetical protein